MFANQLLFHQALLFLSLKFEYFISMKCKFRTEYRRSILASHPAAPGSIPKNFSLDVAEIYRLHCLEQSLYNVNWTHLVLASSEPVLQKDVQIQISDHKNRHIFGLFENDRFIFKHRSSFLSSKTFLSSGGKKHSIESWTDVEINCRCWSTSLVRTNWNNH